MRKKVLLTVISMVVVIPLYSQIFNFSLRTNNQQLIDKAMSGVFVKIAQSYELCDTVKDEHFGRNGKDYFSIIPFYGVETECGLVFSQKLFSPWLFDEDFKEYEKQYKPIITGTSVVILNVLGNTITNLKRPIEGRHITDHLILLNDSSLSCSGLKIDTISGDKEGWLIWLSSTSDTSRPDSIRLTSIRKDIEVPIDGGFLYIDNPEISEPVMGGIYVTPEVSAAGQITFVLTGVIIKNEDSWIVDFPFIQKTKQPQKKLTPISENKFNPLKKKRK